ncbi:hypothetical protein [uncultured Friedmanniella sp.]|uniref:hypothetical protein n=1 Tax=uncultured Friedmanniella sp. TaxID=335381 RepID=UPI0035C9EC13
MSGASAPGTRSPGPHGGGTYAGQPQQSRDLWPRDFGRDGVSGLVTPDRALRARDVSRADVADEELASDVLAELLARVDGRRTGQAPRRRS